MPEAREMHKLENICDMYTIFLMYEVTFVPGRNKQLLSACVREKKLIVNGKIV